jgi:hypothetical protein
MKMPEIAQIVWLIVTFSTVKVMHKYAQKCV